MKIKKSIRSKAFNSKLAAYSATATAALLVAPTVADATIQNITEFSYNGGGSFTTMPPSLSLGGFGSSQKSFLAGPVAGNLQLLRESPLTSSTLERAVLNGINVANSHSIVANRIPLHGSVAGHYFATGGALLAQQATSVHGHAYYGDGGQFLPPANGSVTGYIGFKAIQNAQTYYGWLRVKVDADANGFPDEVSLVAKDGAPTIFGAFGLASDSIKAGDTALPAPEPSVATIGGLGLLALGAIGVREMRRRRKA